MSVIAIYIVLYAILIWADIIPSIKKKQWKALYFSIPVYLVTFAVNMMLAMGFKFLSPSIVIQDIITSIFHLK